MTRGLQSLLIFFAGAAAGCAVLLGLAQGRLRMVDQSPAPLPAAGRRVSSLVTAASGPARKADAAEVSAATGSTIAEAAPAEAAPAATADQAVPDVAWIARQESVLPTGGQPTQAAAWPLQLAGLTEPGYGRFAKLPLATSQPVAFVDVKPGDVIQKGWQVFSHWESPDRLQAVKNDVERTKKQRKIAQTRLAAAEQSLARLEKLTGKVTPQELQDAQTVVAIRRGEAEAAELSVQEADNRFTALDFEFKQAFVTSPIDGVVVSVNVVQGERRQAGESFRGVIVLDSTILNCRCLVAPRQAQLLRQTPAASLGITVSDQERTWPGKLMHVGVMAEGATGLLPVIIEVSNPDRALLCGIAVQVSIEAASPQETSKIP